MVRAATMVALVLAAAGGMQLNSNDVRAGATLARPFMATDCGGRNRSPQLAWTGAPAGTKSFALIVHDPDAPLAGGFYHWVVYNISASSNELPADATLRSDQLGDTSAGKPGYYGPCPPPGPPHHYDWTLYALDFTAIDSRTPLDAAQLQRRMAGHVLARATIATMAVRP